MYNPISAKRLLSCFFCWTPISYPYSLILLLL